VLRNGVPIATGLTYGTTSYTDSTAVVGVTYSYTVRYNNGCSTAAVTTGASKADSGAVTCSASDQCHDAGVCNPANGVCSNPAKPNGSPCSDGDLCTPTDSCEVGQCVGGNPVICTASDDCHNAGVCNPGTGLCSNPARPDASPCDDANFCTTGETCTSGVCGGGSPTPAPPETSAVAAASDKSTYTWAPAPNATRYDALRGNLGAFPVGPGGADELCFDDLAGPTLVDGTIPPPGFGFWYLSRGENTCGGGGNGPYGNQGVNGVPGVARTSTTCP
jgi:hypothetical protein